MSDPPSSPEGLAGRLRQTRIARELTQHELALQAGVKLDTLRSIEQGRTGNPGVFTVARLADELGVSLDFLARGG